MPEIIPVDNLNAEELRMYACTSEVQLRRCFEPEPGIFIAESPKVILRALDAGYEPLSLLAEERLVAHAFEKMGLRREDSSHNPELLGRILERCENVPVYTADPGVLVRITGYHLTQGVLCAMRRRALPAAETVCAGASRIAVLEDIVNPTNVGAIFRSAAALGLGAVLLTSGCCDPLYRRAVRVSMGTVFQIPWTYLDASPPEYVGKLKQLGFAAAAMALEEDSVGIDDPNLAGEKRLAVLLGNEGEGLNAATIRACDYTVKIPMAHDVDSLNVAAASAVVFWQLTR